MFNPPPAYGNPDSPARIFGGNSPERLAQLSDRGRWTRTSTTDLHVPR